MRRITARGKVLTRDSAGRGGLRYDLSWNSQLFRVISEGLLQPRVYLGR